MGQETGERKGHYLNMTANTPEEMYERAEFAKELGMPIVMHDFITGGFTANTPVSKWCRKNGMLLHIHRAMHAVIDRHPKHGIHFREDGDTREDFVQMQGNGNLGHKM